MQQRQFGGQRVLRQAQQQLAVAEQQACLRRQGCLLVAAQLQAAAAVFEAHAIAAVADAQAQLPVGARRDRRVVRGHVRVGQHDVIVQRAADGERPRVHVDQPDTVAHGVDHLGLRKPGRGSRRHQRGSVFVVHPNPCR